MNDRVRLGVFMPKNMDRPCVLNSGLSLVWSLDELTGWADLSFLTNCVSVPLFSRDILVLLCSLLIPEASVNIGPLASRI